MRSAIVMVLSLVSLAAGPAGVIHADGRVLRDGAGKTVQLRGVNFGSWLLMEGWMCPMDSSGLKDDFSVRQTLIDRFGPAEADRLVDVYEDHWITDDDLKNVAAAGLNTVRVPFWYRTLETEDGRARPDGFKHLDWVVDRAAAHGLYVILDLHGAPGGQCDSDTTGRDRRKGPKPDFFTSEANIRRTENLWRTVAGHFKGNATVAMYDALNEPIGAPSRDALWSDSDRLFKAIRSVDPDHAIAIESCWAGKVDGKSQGWGLVVLPPPGRFGWSNVVYEIHSYEWKKQDDAGQIANNDKVLADVDRHGDLNVPVYVGEFNCLGSRSGWVDAIRRFDRAGLSWSTWSYKSTNGTGDNSWGLYNPSGPKPPVPNIKTDSADEIGRKWTACTTATGFAINPMLGPILSTPFEFGGDVSMLPTLELAGAVYSDGDQHDAIRILKNHGSTIFRVRLFVDPDPVYGHTVGATQGLSAVLKLSRRITDVGGKVLLDLHYSDTWADPAHQAKPKAWADLHGARLEQRVEAYTASVLDAMKTNGTPPQYVQVGNEITAGMIWPDGKLSKDEASWDSLAGLISAGVRGVRARCPAAKVIVHTSNGGKAGVPPWFFDHLAKRRVDFDVIGLSFYPFWDDTLDGLKANLPKLDKPVMIVETAYPRRDRPRKPGMIWPATVDGQRQFSADLVDLMRSHHGIGVVWWYPEAEPVKGLSIWEGGSCGWFEEAGKLLPAADMGR